MPDHNSGPPAPSTLDPMLRKLDYWHKLDDADRAALLAIPICLAKAANGQDRTLEQAL